MRMWSCMCLSCECGSVCVCYANVVLYVSAMRMWSCVSCVFLLECSPVCGCYANVVLCVFVIRKWSCLCLLCKCCPGCVRSASVVVCVLCVSAMRMWSCVVLYVSDVVLSVSVTRHGPLCVCYAIWSCVSAMRMWCGAATRIWPCVSAR